MSVKVFAAIIIGSSETEMRIYEFSGKKTMKQVDALRKRLSLGEDAYSSGRLDMEKVSTLCKVLIEYREIAQSYRADALRCCATSAFRELASAELVRDYIETQTKMPIEILSNSEQRFLDYKSIAGESAAFEKIIQSGTAIADIGGNSMQISVFDKDKLITTQNVRMGKVSTRDEYLPHARNRAHYEQIVLEELDHELTGFAKLYQKDREIQNLIVMDSDLSELVRRIREQGILTEKPGEGVGAESFDLLYEQAMRMKTDELSRSMQIGADTAELVIQSLIFCKALIRRTGAQQLWLFDESSCGGMAYDYGVRNRLLRSKHNFEEDILAASRHIAKRYKSQTSHTRQVELLSAEIFQRTKKIHGLGERELLLLRIAAILHSCGKYISLTNVSDCAYHIIMASEIIGLSHDERTIIANVVKYNDQKLDAYREWEEALLTREDYLTVAKLTAILRVANALDKGHGSKFEAATAVLKENKLIFTVNGEEDITLEEVELSQRSQLFEDVLNIHPVIRIRKGGA